MFTDVNIHIAWAPGQGEYTSYLYISRRKSLFWLNFALRHIQCFIGYSGKIGSRGQRTASCQLGMLGDFFIGTNPRWPPKNIIYHRISLNWSISKILSSMLYGKVKYIILKSVYVLIMNKTSYHPWAICAKGVNSKGKSKCQDQIWFFNK